ncbi:MAG: EF-hand domain-containing protein [Planctomycetia bacterium]|nr:EF-hand domain-containing protein [Planctomycetia bacterium]
MRILASFVAASLVLATLCQAASAQFRGRGGDRNGGDRNQGEGERSDGERRFGGGGFGGGGFRWDPKEMLSRMDKNGNGILEGDEMQGPGAGMIVRVAERAGLDPSQPMSIEKLAASMSQGGGGFDPRRPEDGQRGRSDNERRDSGSPSRKPAMKPLVPGFGEEQDLAPPPGFDVPLGSELASAVPLEKRYPERVLEEVKETFRRYDKDKNDILDGEELNAVPWRSDPRESDANKDGRISKLEFVARIAKQRNITPITSTTVRVSAPSSESRSPSAASTGGPNSSSAPRSDADRIRSIAEAMMRQHDRNRSGNLEEAEGEWEELRSSKAADVNNDKVITLDELTISLSNFGDESRSGSSGSSDSRPGFSRFNSRGGSSTKGSEPKNSSGRLLTPQERLPKGLPDWFLSKDANEDGQISMAEYATAWSNSKAEEFAKYDLDGDGFVAPGECLKIEKK